MSASADHVKALVKSHSSGDDQAFYSVALQVAAKAARQGHHRFAADVKSLVEAGKAEKKPGAVTAIAQPRGELADLVTASYPEASLTDLVAPPELTESLRHVIAEQRQRHALIDQGFDPIHRILLEGPPGTGKTMTAGLLAHELDLPLLTIRLDGLLSKYLGETGSKLRVLFDAAASQRAVYLFDEFDAIGGDRAGNDVGEARRILNSFLLFIESVGPESIVVAATNHRSILDRALYRRFDLVLSYALPSSEQSVAVLRSRLGTLGQKLGWTTVAKHTDGLSHAELVRAAETAAKRALLSGKKRVLTAQLVDALKERRSNTSG